MNRMTIRSGVACIALGMAALAGAQAADVNPPGWRGGPGTDWENPPGPVGGPGTSPDRRGYYYGPQSRSYRYPVPPLPYRDRDNNPPGAAGGPGTNWENPPGPVGGPGTSPDRRRW